MGNWNSRYCTTRVGRFGREAAEKKIGFPHILRKFYIVLERFIMFLIVKIQFTTFWDFNLPSSKIPVCQSGCQINLSVSFNLPNRRFQFSNFNFSVGINLPDLEFQFTSSDIFNLPSSDIITERIFSIYQAWDFIYFEISAVNWNLIAW